MAGRWEFHGKSHKAKLLPSPHTEFLLLEIIPELAPSQSPLFLNLSQKITQHILGFLFFFFLIIKRHHKALLKQWKWRKQTARSLEKRPGCPQKNHGAGRRCPGLLWLLQAPHLEESLNFLGENCDFFFLLLRHFVLCNRMYSAPLPAGRSESVPK